MTKFIRIEDCPLLASDGNPCILGLNHKEAGAKYGVMQKCQSDEMLEKFLKRLRQEWRERRR